jgi:hypothetical protein
MVSGPIPAQPLMNDIAAIKPMEMIRAALFINPLQSHTLELGNKTCFLWLVTILEYQKRKKGHDPPVMYSVVRPCDSTDPVQCAAYV